MSTSKSSIEMWQNFKVKYHCLRFHYWNVYQLSHTVYRNDTCCTRGWDSVPAQAQRSCRALHGETRTRPNRKDQGTMELRPTTGSTLVHPKDKGKDDRCQIPRQVSALLLQGDRPQAVALGAGCAAGAQRWLCLGLTSAMTRHSVIKRLRNWRPNKPVQPTSC